jgi:formylglycine-generating enzyme required for sulfatase activity
MKKWAKVSLVIVGALIVTALGIDAADTLTGNGGTLLSSVVSTKNGCGVGMVSVDSVLGISCVDSYEASTGKECPALLPSNSLESYKNADTKACVPVSEEERTPWAFVTRDQAMQLCARAGKRLPTSAEWYALSLGMAETEASCNVQEGAVKETGNKSECVTPEGVHDMVGNLWEWVSDDIIDGNYNNRSLPMSGYVTQVDNTGVAIVTEMNENEAYGKDYFWSSETGAFGMIRGGFYGSGEDAGLYTVHADTLTNAANAGIGFRCVK